MATPQRQSWHALLELSNLVDSDWTLVGGQLVHLHCAERGAAPRRPTNDVDTVVDVRTAPRMLETFTTALHQLGFRPHTSGDGAQYRWTRDQAQIDVLIPEGVGGRAAGRAGAGGARSVSAPGTTQALARNAAVRVHVEGRTGTLLRPTIVGALIVKAAARVEVSEGAAGSRHCEDFTVLSSLIAARDFRDEELSPRDRRRLRRMVAHCRNDRVAMSVPNAVEALNRLERAAKLHG